MGCGALAMRSGLPTASSKISSVCLETSIPTQRRGKIMGPVPVMRGLLAQPRATVQVDGRNGRAGDRAGSRRHAPGTQRLPPHLIMTDPAYTGTQAGETTAKAADQVLEADADSALPVPKQHTM